MQKKLVLCVDDERTVLDSLKEQLKNHLGQDYRIEIAESGEEAIELIDELSVENYEIMLIISDYIMPGMKGDELLKHIHQNFPKTIKVLLTGQATLDGVTNIVNDANLYRFLSKPWQSEDLTMAVTEALKSYDRDRQIEIQQKKLEEQNNELHSWVNSIVEVLSKTLDTRDTTTAGHSKRMAEFALQTAQAIDESDAPAFKNIHFSEEELDALYYATLLHDVGKIGIREYILLKETRVSVECLELIKTRWRFYACILKHEKKSIDLTTMEKLFLMTYEEDFKFIQEINKRGYITKEEEMRVKAIADIKIMQSVNGFDYLLEKEEVSNLTVPKGNLNPDELKIMHSHAALTYEILKDIPWPKAYSRVPEIAASHHEKLNGKGYYKGLKGLEIGIETRILAILDIYEALTSIDRPYSSQRTPEEAFKILKSEADEGYLDQDILKLVMEIIKD